MKKQRMMYFDDWLKERLKDPKFREGYAEGLMAVRLGYRIFQLREARRLTQAQLAKRMGTKQQAIARLERGDYEGFSLKTLQRIADALKVDLIIDFRQTGA